jgi:hypothetical protein
MKDQKQLKNIKYCKNFGTKRTNDARCTYEMKPRIAIAKAAFNKKKTLFTSKLDLYLRKKVLKCDNWSIALYGAENWTLLKVDQKYLESFETCCWRRMEKISWTDSVRYEKVLHRAEGERNILHTINRKKARDLHYSGLLCSLQ